MMETTELLIKRLNQLTLQARKEYEPLVRQLIATDNRDIQLIESILDSLLDFCFADDMLQLYRQLCRHLYGFHPQAALYYVTAYRDLWDEEGTKFGNEIMDEI